jgi:hypothetical protein
VCSSDIGAFTKAQVNANVAWTVGVIRLYREAGWRGPLLLYGQPFANDYWLGVYRNEQPKSKLFTENFPILRDANRKACEALLPHIDGVLLKPQYYYRGPDASTMADPYSETELDRWEHAHRFSVSLARNLCPGAPIWSHLWPRFHDSAKPITSRWRRTDDGITLRRTQVAWEISDAVVYWDRRVADNFELDSYWWRVAEEYALKPVQAGRIDPVRVDGVNATGVVR